MSYGKQILAILDELKERQIRFEERVTNHINSDDKSHRAILSRIDELHGRVNHEVSLLTTSLDTNTNRIQDLEDYKISQESKRKGQIEFFKILSFILGVAVAILAILEACGV